MTTPAVYSAMVAVMEDIGKAGIAKARKNQQQGYNFRGIDDVYNELNSLLAKHKLLMLPTVVSSDQVERTTKGGGAIFYTRLVVDFKLISANDASSETVRVVGEAMDNADKSSNKAQSAAYKYAAMQVFCIPTEGDNDADSTTHEVAGKATVTPLRPAPTPRKTSAQAQRDGDHDRIMGEFAKLDLEGVRKWFEDFDILTADLPKAWLNPLRDRLELRREEIMAGARAANGEAELDAAFRGAVG